MNVWYINSILGAICLEEENDALCGVHFCPDGAPELEPLPRRVVETPLLQEAEEQLNEYFAGVRREFDLPLAAKGTAFQQAVWAQLRRIPLRGGAHLRSTGGGAGQAKGKPRRGQRLSLQPAVHRGALPPGHWRRRQSDRLRRGAGYQGISAGTGAVLRE